MRNVIGHLPQELHNQPTPMPKADRKLDTDAGEARFEQFTSSLETPHPDATASLREGLNEPLTFSRITLARHPSAAWAP